MSGPRIHVLVPVHNRKATTELFVRCLLAQTYENWHLVLIDDGSRDGTEDAVRALAPDVTVLKGAGDWWWGGSLHQGYLWLKRENLPADDVVLTINDDTEFDPDFLAKAVGALRPASLLCAQQYYLTTGKFCEAGVHWDWRKFDWRAVPDANGINCFPTRGLFLTVGDFLRLGGFYPRLLPHYLSDYEFTQRAHRKGFSLITDRQVFLRFDDRLTGVRRMEGTSPLKAMASAFSIRSTENPVYWTSFVLLASPLCYTPVNVFKVWWRFCTPLIGLVRPHLSIAKRRAFKLWKILWGQ